MSLIQPSSEPEVQDSHSHQELDQHLGLMKTTSYPYRSWGETFPDTQVDLSKIPYHESYQEFFEREDIQLRIEKLNKFLSHCLTQDLKLKIFPYPDLVFNALLTTPLDEIKVVILGQDPYHSFQMEGGQVVPQAMGLSFSVPVGVKVPSSLSNVYKNQVKHRLTFQPGSHGNLQFWAYQGCLLLNTSLTVQHRYPGSHVKKWRYFTDELIRFISDKCDHLVFMLWGAHAIEKGELIDRQKHHLIKSSHPSGYSVDNYCRGNKPFSQTNHFREANEQLKKWGQTPIIWPIY